MGNAEFIVLKRIPNGTREGLPAGSRVDASGWKNLRSLIANGYVIPVGESEEVLAEARNIRRGGPRAQQSLVNLGRRGDQLAQEQAPSEAEVAVEESTYDELYEQAQELDVDGRSSMDKEELAEAVVETEDQLKEYESSPGWYEIPGFEKKMRREEALLALDELGEQDGSDEEE